MIVRISDDALARALGADALAEAFANKGHEVHRTSSWGMLWLEPLVEIGGMGFGPVTAEDLDAILAYVEASPEEREERGSGSGGLLGRLFPGHSRETPEMWGDEIVEHPFIARQQRLTFARAGRTRPTSLEDYEATGGWAGLGRARQLGGAAVE